MKTKDLLIMSVQNLLRRKSRSILTVLGVIIGCCSIVIMISIGIGKQESLEFMFSQMGDLSVIQVNTGMGGAKIDDAMIETIRKIPNVVVATPKVQLDGVMYMLYAGKGKRYECGWAEVVGMDAGSAEKLGYTLVSGAYKAAEPYSVLLGQYMAYNFRDTKRPPGHDYVDRYQAYNPDGTMGELPDAFFDPMTTPLTLEITQEKSDKKINVKLVPSGIMKEDYGKGYETSAGIVFSIEDINKIQRLTGKKPSTKGYNNALVKVSDISEVGEVEREIKKLGVGTFSMESIRKPMEDEARATQVMLGALGAISLFVAALGITNTMIMSISERTREIGVMKAIGCFVRDIRTIFLLEAAIIGVVGGAVGAALSLAVSAIVNVMSAQVPVTNFDELMTALTNIGSRTSVIPLWLIGAAIVFSVIIGLGSGFYPANKAVRISALEAIKHE